MLHLYDTATREVRELAMREPGTVGMYLCGPTVYGPPHIGHGRATLVYDVLRRYLEWTGLRVRLVSNVTDIDDAIINRANNENRPWQDITSKCESVWFEAMGKLGVARPTDVPHATQYVEQMVTIALSAGGRRAAICSPFKPPQEIPIIPTTPLHQGCAASHAITSTPSSCSCFAYSSNSKPSESPHPLMSTRTPA